MRRSRITYTIWIFLVILLGLVSRSNSPLVLPFLKEYAGDALWALVAYLLIGCLFPRLSIRMVAVTAGLFCFAVEVSQLYHAPWIDDIRRLRLGALILGFGFLWSDLICYSVGIGIGVLLEWCAKSNVFSGKRVRSD